MAGTASGFRPRRTSIGAEGVSHGAQNATDNPERTPVPPRAPSRNSITGSMCGLIKRIEQAFRNIPRGEVGIREAAAMDARLYEGGLHEDKKRYAQSRAADIEENWQEIPDEVLAADNAVFTYLDDAGFKFIMPAIMRWSSKPVTVDKNHVAEFFAMRLLPESRKADKPEAMVQKWRLSKEQIVVIAEWLENYLSRHSRCPSALEVAQFERWKELAHRA